MPSRRELNKQMQKTFYVLFVGLFGAVLAGSIYPLLDVRALIVLVGVLFLLPFAIHITFTVRNRFAANVGRLASLNSYCGAALIGVAAFLGLNGLLDRAPAQVVRTSIVHKRVMAAAKGGGVTHVLDVSSWRSGHVEEHLVVSAAQYRSTVIGNLVAIEVHRGRFGLPWYRWLTP